MCFFRYFQNTKHGQIQIIFIFRCHNLCWRFYLISNFRRWLTKIQALIITYSLWNIHAIEICSEKSKIRAFLSRNPVLNNNRILGRENQFDYLGLGLFYYVVLDVFNKVLKCNKATGIINKATKRSLICLFT